MLTIPQACQMGVQIKLQDDYKIMPANLQYFSSDGQKFFVYMSGSAFDLSLFTVRTGGTVTAIHLDGIPSVI